MTKAVGSTHTMACDHRFRRSFGKGRQGSARTYAIKCKMVEKPFFFFFFTLQHRCLQAWAYQDTTRVVGKPYVSNLEMENHLLAMPRHQLFSTGASALQTRF